MSPVAETLNRRNNPLACQWYEQWLCQWLVSRKKEISYTESTSYSMKEIFMEHFNRLSHSIWDCKYHIIWIPKYRRKELYGAKRRIVVDTIKQWARIKGIEIIEGYAMPDHIHLCVSIPPKYAVAHTIGLLKGKSASERWWALEQKAAEWWLDGHFGHEAIVLARLVLMRKLSENTLETKKKWICSKGSLLYNQRLN